MSKGRSLPELLEKGIAMAQVDLIGTQIKSVDFKPFEYEQNLAEVKVAKVVSQHKIVVIIPAYNEERFIGSVILQARKYADEVILVDDGSSDATAEIAQIAGAIVVRHEQNQGKGVALNSGFRKARELNPDVVVTLDADGQHLPDEIILVATPIFENRADIVVGSRYLERVSNVPRHRVWGHHVFNFLTNRVSGLKVTDSQSGFRGFSPLALSEITFSSKGFSVESEMQLLAREHNLRVDEVSITIQYLDSPKRSVLGQGLTVLNGLLRLTGQYRPLLFFGLPGTLLLLTGLTWAGWIVNVYRTSQTLPLGDTVFSGLLATLGSLSIFTGIILHSVRGLLLDLVHSKD